MAAILQDVVALVVCADRTLNAKEALRNRLQGCGAKVATRLGQDVTHVIFERRRGQRASDKATEEADILNFYRKLDAVSSLPSPLLPVGRPAVIIQPPHAGCSWTTPPSWFLRFGWSCPSPKAVAWSKLASL